MHLKLKFPIMEGRVISIRVNEKVPHNCYENNLRNKRGPYVDTVTSETNALEVDLDPAYKEQRPKLVGGIEEVHVREGRMIKIGA